MSKKIHNRCDRKLIAKIFEQTNKGNYIFHNGKSRVHNTGIFVFAGHLECESRSNCVQWIGQCYLFKLNLEGKQKTISIQLFCEPEKKRSIQSNRLTAVTPAPAPAMNLSKFLMYLFAGITAPIYCNKSNKHINDATN